MMLERERAAQTAYMQRYANLQSYKAGDANGGVFGDRDPDGPRTVQGRREAVRYMPEQTVEAISRGLSKPESEVLDSQLLTETAQRGLTDAQAAKATAEGQKLAAEAANIPEQLKFDRDKFDKNYVIDLRKQTAAEQAQEFEQENYVKPGVYGDDFGGRFSVGGATPIFDPREVAGGRGYMGPRGDVTAFPVADPVPLPEPTRVGGSLVDPLTGEEIYREPTEMEGFDRFARDRFKGSAAFPGDGASNEEIEAAYQKWFKKEYPPKKR